MKKLLLICSLFILSACYDSEQQKDNKGFKQCMEDGKAFCDCHFRNPKRTDLSHIECKYNKQGDYVMFVDGIQASREFVDRMNRALR